MRRPDRSPSLEKSIGYLLRKAYQRNVLIYQKYAPHPELTAVQAAALMALHDYNPCSLTELGRMTAMDPATTRGVIERLRKRRLVATQPGTDDRREVMVCLDRGGQRLAALILPTVPQIGAETMEALNEAERLALRQLLKKISGDVES